MPPTKLTWKDIARAHVQVKKGLYKSEQEVWQREADILNRIISNGQPNDPRGLLAPVRANASVAKKVIR